MAAVRKCHTLQRVLFPKPAFPAELYLQCRSGAAAGEGAVTLPPGARLLTNTYFNSFYLDHWRKFTGIGAVGVCIAFTGHIKAGIRSRRDGHLDHELVSRTAIGDGGGIDELILWPGEPAEGVSDGRLFAEIEAVAASEVHAISYVTDTAPQHEVSLSIGICTFNREEHLLSLVRELIGVAGQSSAVRRVHVVNQGASFASRELVELFRDHRLELLEQANLGGCGGFNRTIHEALKAIPRCSHHVLMDDDVRIDGRVIDTAATFLAYADRDIVLGGHMLQTDAPTLLFEAGAVFDPVWFVVPVGKGTDLSNPENLDLFNAFRPVGYNGWWFCALPVPAMEKAGFSPPVFIRGDDMEYGCRMEKFGVPTVPLPGIGVWHDLNYSHASDWDQYYDMRNRLILSTLHGDITPQPAALFVFGYVLECILTHRYAAARMCMEGISDFLMGPDRLFAVDPAERHRRVSSLAKSMPQDKLKEADARLLQRGEAVERPSTVQANAPVYLRRLFAVFALPHQMQHQKLYRYDEVNPLTVGNAAYVVCDARMTAFVRHVPRRGRAIGLLIKAIALTVRFVANRARVNADWPARIGVHQSRDAWKRLFALERER
jgi:galactofuranosylgalactofuranosylrhamnosyl-N-acetylglucosaminyl-diphospho-decaprenol beta-1,5/1,6-galactofuranosyltransferase